VFYIKKKLIKSPDPIMLPALQSGAFKAKYSKNTCNKK